jgi:hypothetical protein
MNITLLKRKFCRVFSKIKGKCICTFTLQVLDKLIRGEFKAHSVHTGSRKDDE